MSSSSTVAQWVGDILLFLTLCAAIWYAWETRKMRLQAIRPKVIFATREHVAELMEDLETLDLSIRNVGDGVAINVSIEPGQHEGFKFRFEPERISILEKGAEWTLAMLPTGGSYRPNISTILSDASVSCKITARYLDVEGREFRTSTVVGRGAKPPFIVDE